MIARWDNGNVVVPLTLSPAKKVHPEARSDSQKDPRSRVADGVKTRFSETQVSHFWPTRQVEVVGQRPFPDIFEDCNAKNIKRAFFLSRLRRFACCRKPFSVYMPNRLSRLFNATPPRRDQSRRNRTRHFHLRSFRALFASPPFNIRSIGATHKFMQHAIEITEHGINYYRTSKSINDLWNQNVSSHDRSVNSLIILAISCGTVTGSRPVYSL